MQTENLSGFDSDDIHTKRLVMFTKYFQTGIKSTNHYLKLINFSAFDYVLLVFRIKSVSKKIYRFVVK